MSTVYVPARLVEPLSACPIVPVSLDSESATEIVVSKYVQDLAGQWSTVSFVLPPGSIALRRQPGVLVLHVGTISHGRDARLQSLASSVYEFLNVTLGGCAETELREIRTLGELRATMRVDRGRFSHVILVGHGTVEGLPFLDSNGDSIAVSAEELADALTCNGDCEPLVVVSVCCHSGCQALGEVLSRSSGVSVFVAPSKEIDASWAHVFIAGFMLAVFEQTKSVEDAVRQASSPLPDEWRSICVWRDGGMSCL